MGAELAAVPNVAAYPQNQSGTSRKPSQGEATGDRQRMAAGDSLESL